MIHFDQKLKEYSITNQLEQELVLTNILQEYILGALAESQFFKIAAFHGGTSLNILYGLDRYSEDLDFILLKPNDNFEWQYYLNKIKAIINRDGIPFEILDKTKTNQTVQKAFLKTDSIGKLIIIDLEYNRNIRQKINIKLEIDTNPPLGSVFETKFINFPSPQSITSQNLASNFGLKLHALLCRNYLKGRDWYDFVYYITKKITPNFKLLGNALYQQGPWKNQRQSVDQSWVLNHMAKKIKSLDFKTAVKDVARFIPAKKAKNLDQIWSQEYFLDMLSRFQME